MKTHSEKYNGAKKYRKFRGIKKLKKGIMD